jgi:hypothetical protein
MPTSILCRITRFSTAYPRAQVEAAEGDTPDPDLPPLMLHEDDIEDWYKLRADYDIGKAPVCFKMQSIAEKDSRVPINHRAAMRDPLWRDAVDKELSKFEVNHCLHVVPTMWTAQGTSEVALLHQGGWNSLSTPDLTGRANDPICALRPQCSLLWKRLCMLNQDRTMHIDQLQANHEWS